MSECERISRIKSHKQLAGTMIHQFLAPLNTLCALMAVTNASAHLVEPIKLLSSRFGIVWDSLRQIHADINPDTAEELLQTFNRDAKILLQDVKSTLEYLNKQKDFHALTEGDPELAEMMQTSISSELELIGNVLSDTSNS